MAGVIKRDVRDSKPDWGPTRWPGRPRASVPYVFNLRMDPAEKMDPHSHEWGYIGRKFVASKLWAPTAAGDFIARQQQLSAGEPIGRQRGRCLRPSAGGAAAEYGEVAREILRVRATWTRKGKPVSDATSSALTAHHCVTSTVNNYDTSLPAGEDFADAGSEVPLDPSDHITNSRSTVILLAQQVRSAGRPTTSRTGPAAAAS